MAVWKLGDSSESVAKIQRWLIRLQRSNPSVWGNPVLTVTGKFDANTQAALKKWQQVLKIPATGVWDAKTAAKAVDFTKYVTGGKTSDPFKGFGDQTIASDRAWVVEQWQYLFGKKPTVAELDYEVHRLQAGLFTRTSWMAGKEKRSLPEALDRIFNEVLGRPPTAAEIADWSAQFMAGNATRTSLQKYLSTTPEALLRDTTSTEDTPDELDAKAYLDGLLAEYGLSSLGDWAWERIQAGDTPTRILQELRQRQEYKDRFAGMAARDASGYPAISESEYLALERQYHQLMQRAGLPPGFYNDPTDFAELIGLDLSPLEVQARIEDGWARVKDAPAAVRAAFEQFYGPMSDADLAAYFLDPDKVESDLLRRAEAARTAGIGSLYDLNLDQTRAEELVGRGVSSDEAEDAFGQLATITPLFEETISEDEDLTAEQEGLNATLGLDSTSARSVERRRSEREAALSGGGGAADSRTGLGVGAAD